jgi:glycosyltransferase involved in cell wall biosynthesis
MRVLVVHNRYRSAQPSGENIAVDDQIALLESAGCEVLRYERESDDIRTMPLVRKASVPLQVAWSRRARSEIKRVLTSEEVDLVHVHNTFPLISPAILGACKRAGVPVVATLHNYRLMCVNGLLFRDGRPCEVCVGRSSWAGVRHGCYRDSRILSLPIALGTEVHRGLGTWTKGVTQFIALSNFARDKFVLGGLPPAQVEVLPNAVPRPAVGREGPGDYFLYLGRLSPEKGVDILADAWNEAFGKLLIVGDGPARPGLQARMSTSNGSVSFLGQRPRDECIELLRNARALVVSSRVYEGSPVALAEAYASGVPVVAPDIGAFREYVEHGETGLLFTDGQSDELRARLGELVDESAALRMGLGARDLYERVFAPEHHRRALVALYDRTVAEPMS